jgi:hypothetical protein
MARPDIPKSPVPMLTEVVQVNGSLRPAVLPWAQVTEDAPSNDPPVLAPDQEALADQVIARVQLKLAPLLPDMLRDAVDEVLREHLAQSQAVVKTSSK